MSFSRNMNILKKKADSEYVEIELFFDRYMYKISGNGTVLCSLHDERKRKRERETFLQRTGVFANFHLFSISSSSSQLHKVTLFTNEHFSE